MTKRVIKDFIQTVFLDPIKNQIQRDNKEKTTTKETKDK